MGEIRTYYTRQDLNAMLYAALTPIRSSISGGIYIDNERPNNSESEDIVINTPSLTIGRAGEVQKGYSNINIYCPKVIVKTTQGTHYAYNSRTEIITKLVIDTLSSMQIEGYLDIESETEEGSADTREFFINIRIYWKILKTE